MRLIVARCEVTYTGRLTAVLPMALRLLMLKSDGSVLVHADTGGLQAAELQLDRHSASVRSAQCRRASPSTSTS